MGLSRPFVLPEKLRRQDRGIKLASGFRSRMRCDTGHPTVRTIPAPKMAPGPPAPRVERIAHATATAKDWVRLGKGASQSSLVRRTGLRPIGCWGVSPLVLAGD